MSDGKIVIDDKTIFDSGDFTLFAGKLNNLNELLASHSTSIEDFNNSLTASDGLNFRFAVNGEGKHGYLGADDSFIPFSMGDLTLLETKQAFIYHNVASQSVNYTITEDCDKILLVVSASASKVDGSPSLSLSASGTSLGGWSNPGRTISGGKIYSATNVQVRLLENVSSGTTVSASITSNAGEGYIVMLVFKL